MHHLGNLTHLGSSRGECALKMAAKNADGEEISLHSLVPGNIFCYC